jgi:hypothetical protein
VRTCSPAVSNVADIGTVGQSILVSGRELFGLGTILWTVFGGEMG